MSRGLQAGAVTEAARLLYAAVQLRFPDLRSLLISGVGSSAAAGVARALADTVSATGRHVALGIVGEGPGNTFGSAIPGSPARGSGPTMLDLADRALMLDVCAVRALVAARAQEGLVVFATGEICRGGEGMVLASCVDGVVLVAQEGRTRLSTLADARAQLEVVAARLIGSVYVSIRGA